MKWSRCLTLLLVLYVGVDFLDPAIPGVFFFDNPALFLDGVVQVKDETVADFAVAPPLPLGRSMETAEPSRLPKRAVLGAFAQPRHGPRTHPHQDLPTSGASPSTLEDH